MNRRDILIFGGVIVWGLLSYYVIPWPETSAQILVHIDFLVIGLLAYLVLLIVLSNIFPKFGKWGDKKIFKKH